MFNIEPSKYQRRLLDITRQGADTTSEPGEGSLSNQGFWSRYGSNWLGGAGQRKFDFDRDSNRTRFFTSLGLNVWTPDQLTLLNDCEQKRSSAQTNLKMLAVSGFVYLVDGTALVRTADMTPAGPTFTTITGTPGTAINDICTDGTAVYIATASGVYKAAISGTSAAVFGAATATQVCQMVNGRMMIGRGQILAELDNAGAATTLYTHYSTNFLWTAIWAGPQRIYAAGYADVKGDVFKVGINETTGALTQPTYATYFPLGELVNAAMFYAGFMVFGTNKGIRISSVSTDDGSLTYGPLIDEPGSVSCLVAEGLYIWFGWTNYSASKTGTGRLGFDSPFTGTLTPPFATDIMATAQGTVTTVTRYGSKVYFGVSGQGFYGENTTLLAAGLFDTGWISFGTPEKKSAIHSTVRHAALTSGQTVSVSIISDQYGTQVMGTSNTVGSFEPPEPALTDIPGPFYVPGVRVDRLRLSITLNAGGAGSPTLYRWALRAAPAPVRAETLVVPVISSTTVKTGAWESTAEAFDRFEFYVAMLALATSGDVVVYQEGNHTWQVKVESVAMEAERFDPERDWFSGYIYLNLITV
jgi:hypothetical protein